MALFRDRDKKIFPLRNIDSVLQLFRTQLENGDEPNLSLLSIVIGAIENSLTCNRSTQVTTTAPATTTTTGCLEDALPSLSLSTVEALYQKFQAQIRGSVDLSQFHASDYACRDLVKRVSDVVWSSLTRSNYKDRAHLQSLYSYLTGNKLDCFGVAFAVVAACQVLGFKDVHLTLSEDHAWVIFGKDGDETAEVTWHGKGHEDKRGLPITVGVAEKSWLYLNGHPVKCSRHMEVAALVSGMNPAINASTDSVELGALQQQLLWLLYDMGHLTKYPMALGNLGDLEEISATSGRPHCTVLFQEAIAATRIHYNNHHVYPYTYLGGYMYRNKKYKEALEAWANAADVIRTYNYNREDEEIYKEFLEIANDLIPNVVKLMNSGVGAILGDPECFVFLLRFYDGICEWEEGSSTPVLHIGWARPLVNTISKFEAPIRSKVDIEVDAAVVPPNQSPPPPPTKVQVETNNNEVVVVVKELPATVVAAATNGTTTVAEEEEEEEDEEDAKKRRRRRRDCGNGGSRKRRHHHHRRTSDFIRCLETQINPDEAPHPNIAALAAACADNILNPEYLLGSGEPPFSSSSSRSNGSLGGSPPPPPPAPCSRTTNGGGDVPVPVEDESKDEEQQQQKEEKEDEKEKRPVVGPGPPPKVRLCSEKMKGLRELLLAEKLNVSAIQLQLTAQSQVQVVRRVKSSVSGDFDFVGLGCLGSGPRSTKRSRRD